MNRGLIKYGMSNLIHRKTRSWLTILSILIGITAIFTLVSFGLGIKTYVDTVAKEAGADKLMIQAKGSSYGLDSNFYISQKDLDFIKKVKGVKRASGMYMKIAQVDFKGDTVYVFVAGYDPKDNDFMMESFGIDIADGRALRSGEIGKAVIGYNYMFDDKLFSRAVSTGDKIFINGQEFQVAGFMSEVGNPQDDSNIYLSEKGMEDLYPDIAGKYAMVMAQADSTISPKDLADKITEKLRKEKGQEKGKEDFFVQTFEDAIATFVVIIDVINGVLFLIALVSMIVASVNIMNTMYTSVIERTKEIGIMKAIGARNSDIVFIFVFESGLLGFIGGLLGVGLGYVISTIAGAIAMASGFALLKPAFPLSLILGCLFFGFFVGALAGILPARKAAKLNPVDALRYE